LAELCDEHTLVFGRNHSADEALDELAMDRERFSVDLGLASAAHLVPHIESMRVSMHRAT
jgi:hypothetical protein